MKKHRISPLLVITAIFVAFTLGLFLGRNQNKHTISLSVSADMQTTPAEPPTIPESILSTAAPILFPIIINIADKEMLMALPGIGEVLAERILSYRTEYGYFATVEGLLNVEGIGEKRIEEILDLITIGG